MFGDKNYSDDLINEKVEPIIIKQESGDKKFIYTIIAILVLLFLLALGVIAFLGSKYFNSKQVNTTQSEVVKSVDTNKEEKVAQPKKVEIAKTTKVQKVSIENNSKKEADTKGLEQLIKSSETKEETKAKDEPKVEPKIKQAVNAVANQSKGGVKLSKEEMATIAKLVAQELAKNNKLSNNNAKSASSNKDTSLVKALEAAPTDTLKEKKIDTSKVASGDVKAKSNSNKKIDTFNKVIVKQKTNGDDEFAKLTQEIDSILNTKDVKAVQSKNQKAIDAEVKEREKELRFIVVKQGDTLSSIARRAYGKSSAYRIIYQANPGLIKNPNRIYIGMKLRVPALSKGN